MGIISQWCHRNVLNEVSASNELKRPISSPVSANIVSCFILTEQLMHFYNIIILAY